MQIRSFSRRLVPLSFARSLITFGDIGFKVLVSLMIVQSGHNANFIYLALASFLPYILLAPFIGFAGDYLPKRLVIMISALLQAMALLWGLYEISNHNAVGCIAVAAVITSLSAFVSATHEAMLPESFNESELPLANGSITFARVLGLTASIITTVLLSIAFYWNLTVVGTMLFCISAVAFFAAVRILPFPSEVQRHKELRYPVSDIWSRVRRELKRNRWLKTAAIWDVFAVSAFSVCLLLLLYFGVQDLALSGQFSPWLLPLALTAGVGIGCYLAGKLSKGKIQLGMIPLGALGMVVMLLLAIFFPGHETELNLRFPGFIPAEFRYYDLHVFFPVLFFLVGTGMCGGLFLIPLRSFYQKNLSPEIRAGAISLRNAAAIIGAAILIAIAVLLLLPVEKWPYYSPISPRLLLTILAGTVLVLTIFTMYVLPNFLLRFIMLALSNTLFKVRVIGAENLPENGPALVISNHASAFDSILISSCTSRQIRFLMNEEYYSHPLLGFLARMTEFFKVPSVGKIQSMKMLFAEIKTELRYGGIVCVFPENRVSRNGLMGAFRHGYHKMLPEDVEVPIIPVSISYVWNQIFTHETGKLKFRFPPKLPFYAQITIGAPMSDHASAFEIRQEIAEIAADSAKKFVHLDERPLHYTLARHAKSHPLRPLLSDYNGRQLGAFQLFYESLLLSREIRRRVKSNSKFIGVFLPNSTLAAEAILAALYADKTPAPLNYSAPRDIVIKSAEKAEISLILTSRAFLEKLNFEPLPQMVFVEDIFAAIPWYKRAVIKSCCAIVPYRELMNFFSPLSAQDMDEIAALLFSSGSTGVPKGVLLSQHNMYSDVMSLVNAINLNSTDSFIGNLPLFHSFGLNVCFFLPLLYNTPVVYVDNPLDSHAILSSIKKHSVSVLFATPSFLQKILHRAEEHDFDSLRLVSTGAEKLRVDLAERFREFVHGRLEIIEIYGCTELSPVVSFNLASDATKTGQSYGKAGSIGAPLENISVRILDPITFRPVPPNTEGLLFVKGPIVMQGYLKDHARTEKVIRDGYYDTGDVAMMDESGYITICGRLSRFSKIAGEMVPHEMVEVVIHEICKAPGRVVAVGGMPDPVKGEVLLVLYTDEMPLTPRQVVDEMRERSISNLWIPKAINFHKVDNLPLLGSGKLDLTQLSNIAQKITLAKSSAPTVE